MKTFQYTSHSETETMDFAYHLASKLQIGVNYLDKSINIAEADKKNLFGIVGSLSETDIKHLIFEVLNPIGYNLMVTPKEEDFVIEKLASLISDSLNQSLHTKVKHTID